MNDEDIRYQQAKKKVEAIKGFYVHLSMYLLVNLFLFLLNIVNSPDNLWFYWPLLGWGIGVVANAVSVFGFGGMFNDKWEERKVRELMDKK